MKKNSEITKTSINKLVVIGVGLIGGSLALGMKSRSACNEVIGISRSPVVRRIAVENGVADRCCSSLKAVASELGEGDVIFIAVPTLSVESVLKEISEFPLDKVTITDGSSVKGSVRDAAKRVFGKVPKNLVLGHPIAGSEKSGVGAANRNLYEHHRCILTPVRSTDRAHLEVVKKMWTSVGAEVLEMTVEEHDKVLGATSHLPHVIAYSLVDTLASDIRRPNIFRYAAGGFKDFTRIASSDPVMWNDIMLANKDDVLASLDKFISNLERLRSSIARAESSDILATFERAKRARDKLISSFAVDQGQKGGSKNRSVLVGRRAEKSLAKKVIDKPFSKTKTALAAAKKAASKKAEVKKDVASKIKEKVAAKKKPNSAGVVDS